MGLGERSYPGLIEAWTHGGSAESADEYDLRDSEPWNEADPAELIRRAASAREDVVARLEAVEDWAARRTVDGSPATLADLAYRITQEDATILRLIGERLHDADLGSSPVTRLQ